MKRRLFIASAAAGTTVTVAACNNATGPAVQTDETRNIRWRMVSSYTPALDTIYGGSEFFAERVKELTNGRFEISISAAGEIVPGLEVLDAVQQGTVEAGHTNSYYYRGKNEALAFDTAVPFGFNYRQQNAWLYQGGGLDLIHELLSDFNIISLPGGNSGTQMGGWWKRPVNSVSELQGINMRIPGLGGEVLQRMGVNVQNLSSGEIFQALQLGAIDAAEWVGPYDDEKLGLFKAAPIYYYPGWWEPGTQFSFYFNLSAWNDLPRSYQHALRTAAAEAHLEVMSRYDAGNPGALRSLLDQGVQLERFSKEIMTTARQTAFDLYEELAAADATYNKIYTAWKQFQGDSNRWFATSELGYTDFVFNPT